MYVIMDAVKLMILERDVGYKVQRLLLLHQERKIEDRCSVLERVFFGVDWLEAL